MDWSTLAATSLGALIGVGSSIVTDRSRHRRQAADRDRETLKTMYAHCLVTFRQAHEAMRIVATSHGQSEGEQLSTKILEAYRSAGADEAREAIMLVAPEVVLAAVDSAYRNLRLIRETLAAGHGLESAQYNEARQLHGDATRFARSIMRTHLKTEAADLTTG